MVDNVGSPNQELRRQDDYAASRDHNPEAENQQNYQKHDNHRS